MTFPISKLVVVWRVTERCDFACHFCGSSRTLKRERADADAARVLGAGALWSEYQKRTGCQVLVSWLGGEPFLWQPLWDISKQFRNEFGLRVGVTTNGCALVSETTQAGMLDAFDQVTFSLDGIGAFHDRVRAANHSYAQLQAAIPKLVARKRMQNAALLVRVNTILMRDNIAAFENLCAQVCAWGVDELTFNLLGGRERPEFFPQQRVLPAQFDTFAEQLPRIREKMNARGLRISGSHAYVERLRMATRSRSVPIDDCAPGQEFLFVDAQGFAAPCAYTTRGYGIPVGQLRSVEDMSSLAARFSRQREAQKHAACADCPATHVFEKFAPVTYSMSMLSSL